MNSIAGWSHERNLLVFSIFLILDEVSEEITAASKVPYYPPWTLSDVKTAAWLVEQGHLTQLERVMIPSDLDTSSVSLDTIRRVASKNLTKPDEEILIKPSQGLNNFCFSLL